MQYNYEEHDDITRANPEYFVHTTKPVEIYSKPLAFGHFTKSYDKVLKDILDYLNKIKYKNKDKIEVLKVKMKQLFYETLNNDYYKRKINLSNYKDNLLRILKCLYNSHTSGIKKYVSILRNYNSFNNRFDYLIDNVENYNELLIREDDEKIDKICSDIINSVKGGTRKRTIKRRTIKRRKTKKRQTRRN